MNERIEQATREYVDNLVNSRDGSSYSIHQKRLAARFDAYDLEECVCNIVEVLLSHQWISVEEELPPYEEDVFVMNADGDAFGCWRTKSDVEYKDENDFVNYHPTKITHWMEIPTLQPSEQLP